MAFDSGETGVYCLLPLRRGFAVLATRDDGDDGQ